MPRHDPAVLAGKVADALVEGGGLLRRNSALGPISATDHTLIHRVVGESIERFNARISDKLGEIGDQVLDKIKAKLANDEFKSSELAFLYSVMHDKRLSAEGKNQVANAAINIQINNNGTNLSKDDLIAMLEGRKAPMPAQEQAAVELEPERKAG